MIHILLLKVMKQLSFELVMSSFLQYAVQIQNTFINPLQDCLPTIT